MKAIKVSIGVLASLGLFVAGVACPALAFIAVGLVGLGAAFRAASN